ncbi:MAG: hypothetical protein H6619_04185 [Deltaproteobacteria bacterium]|nr:hypothetical protein [Deltaproteobacteria bacterium]
METLAIYGMFSFSFLILLSVVLLVQMVIVWMGMVFTKVGTSFVGLFLISLGMTLPGMIIPGILGSFVGLVLFWLLTAKLTNADGFTDIILLVVVVNIFSALTLATITAKVQDFLAQQEILEVAGVTLRYVLG